MNAQIQSLYLLAGDNGTVTYSLVIPIAGLTDDCGLAITDSKGVKIPYSPNTSGEYTIERNDPVGEYAFVITVTRRGEREACVAKQLAVSILDGGSSVVTNAVKASCAPIILAWNEKTKAIADDLWLKFGNSLIPALNSLLLEARSEVGVWPKYCYLLYYLIPYVNKEKEQTELVLSIFEKAVEWADPQNKGIWLNQGLLVQVHPVRMNKFCLNAIRCGVRGDSRTIDMLQSTTPTAMKEMVSEAIIEAGYWGFKEVELLRNFNYRKGLPRILQGFQNMSPGDSNSAALMNLMGEWDYMEAAPAILEFLDMAVDVNICIRAFSALKRLDYRTAAPVLKQMVPVSADAKAALITGLLKEWGVT